MDDFIGSVLWFAGGRQETLDMRREIKTGIALFTPCVSRLVAGKLFEYIHPERARLPFFPQWWRESSEAYKYRGEGM
jgi:hypothetical protein